MTKTVLILGALIALVSCDKGASGGGAASSAATPAKCSADQYQNTDPPFCFSAPAGLKPEAPKDWDKTVFVSFSGKAGEPDMKLSWYKAESDLSRYDELLGFIPKLAAEAKKQVVTSEATAGGKGKVFTLKDDFNQTVHAYYKGSKRLWECLGVVPKDKPLQSALHACKSFTPP
jgi:hypothetical protein